ncbi:MAG: hypothetical protein QOJ59_3794, partial [Thermomicrobiales bacterium]|nr:hypothetical protein [Thermomicrobiales bacterium]
SRTRIATNGNAVRVTNDPKIDTVCAAQRWTKSGLRQRPVSRNRTWIAGYFGRPSLAT